MILSNRSKTIVLWGCQITGEAVKAELGFFDAGISEAKTLLSDAGGTNRVMVIVPPNVKRMFIPGKAQNVILSLSIN